MLGFVREPRRTPVSENYSFKTVPTTWKHEAGLFFSFYHFSLFTHFGTKKTAGNVSCKKVIIFFNLIFDQVFKVKKKVP